jgi:hypothetical protein
MFLVNFHLENCILESEKTLINQETFQLADGTSTNLLMALSEDIIFTTSQVVLLVKSLYSLIPNVANALSKALTLFATVSLANESANSVLAETLSAIGFTIHSKSVTIIFSIGIKLVNKKIGITYRKVFFV